MNQIDVKTLLEKYRTGMASKQEQLLLESWYARESINQMERPELEDYARIKKEMWVVMERQMVVKPDQKRIKLWPRIATAAAAIVAVTLGVWLYYNPFINTPHAELVSATKLANDIYPGKNTATLTLADGRKINLSESKTGVVINAAKLTYVDGEELASGQTPSGSRAVKVMSLRTPRGGQYQVVLPDGSRVWLNAASSIKFPSSFKDERRRVVQLEGEAYFEIFKSKTQKFVVESKGQTVEVLGTHFNINSYTDEGSVKTTLLEGSIRVSDASGLSSGTKVLCPGQQSILFGSKKIEIKQVDPTEYLDWKNGLFIFNKEPLERIMRKISRWYDVDVVFENEQLKQKLFGGTVSRSGNVSEVLEILELTELAHFKIVGRSIMVTK